MWFVCLCDLWALYGFIGWVRAACKRPAGTAPVQGVRSTHPPRGGTHPLTHPLQPPTHSPVHVASQSVGIAAWRRELGVAHGVVLEVCVLWCVCVCVMLDVLGDVYVFSVIASAHVLISNIRFAFCRPAPRTSVQVSYWKYV